MVLEVVGSIPITRPIKQNDIQGCRQAVRHWILIPAFVGSNPATPAKFDSLAQSVEHVTFNHGVRGSNPRWITTLDAHL